MVFHFLQTLSSLTFNFPMPTVGIKKKSRVPGVMITQFIETLPEGKSHPDFSRKPIALTIQEGRTNTSKGIIVSINLTKFSEMESPRFITDFGSKPAQLEDCQVSPFIILHESHSLMSAFRISGVKASSVQFKKGMILQINNFTK